MDGASGWSHRDRKDVGRLRNGYASDFSEWTQSGHENTRVLNESLPKAFLEERAQGLEEHGNLPYAFFLLLLRGNFSKGLSKEWVGGRCRACIWAQLHRQTLPKVSLTSLGSTT